MISLVSLDKALGCPQRGQYPALQYAFSVKTAAAGFPIPYGSVADEHPVRPAQYRRNATGPRGAGPARPPFCRAAQAGEGKGGEQGGGGVLR